MKARPLEEAATEVALASATAGAAVVVGPAVVEVVAPGADVVVVELVVVDEGVVVELVVVDGVVVDEVVVDEVVGVVAAVTVTGTVAVSPLDSPWATTV